MTRIGISHADIVTTHACNMNCKYCIDKFKGSSSGIVELGYVKKFLELLKEKTYKVNFAYDNNPKIEILLLGGEPTLLGSDYLIEIAKIVKSYGFEICISTNGIKKETIKNIIPFFDWVQITCYSDSQIDFWRPYKNKINIKMAGDETLSLERFKHFVEYTKDFARKSLTLYFKPDFELLCQDEKVLTYFDSAEWKRLGSYMYAFIDGVRIKKPIFGVTNIIDEPLIPKLYPNGTYNKTWLHEEPDEYIGELSSMEV